jgi:hypothetical protein
LDNGNCEIVDSFAQSMIAINTLPQQSDLMTKYTTHSNCLAYHVQILFDQQAVLLQAHGCAYKSSTPSFVFAGSKENM